MTKLTDYNASWDREAAKLKVKKPGKVTPASQARMSKLKVNESSLVSLASSELGKSLGHAMNEYHGIKPDPDLQGEDAYKRAPTPVKNPLKSRITTPMATIDPIKESQERKQARTAKKVKSPKTQAAVPDSSKTTVAQAGEMHGNPGDEAAKTPAVKKIKSDAKKSNAAEGRGSGYAWNPSARKDVAVRTDKKPTTDTPDNPDAGRAARASRNTSTPASASRAKEANTVKPVAPAKDDSRVHVAPKVAMDFSPKDVPHTSGGARSHDEASKGAAWDARMSEHRNSTVAPSHDSSSLPAHHPDNPGSGRAPHQAPSADYLPSVSTGKDSSSFRPKSRFASSASAPSERTKTSRGSRSDTTGNRTASPRPAHASGSRPASLADQNASIGTVAKHSAGAMVAGPASAAKGLANTIKTGAKAAHKFYKEKSEPWAEKHSNTRRGPAPSDATPSLARASVRTIGSAAKSAAKELSKPVDISSAKVEWGKPGTIAAKNYSPSRNLSGQQFNG